MVGSSVSVKVCGVPDPPALVAVIVRVYVAVVETAVGVVKVISPVLVLIDAQAGPPVMLKEVGLLVAVTWNVLLTPAYTLALALLVICGEVTSDAEKLTLAMPRPSPLLTPVPLSQ